MHYVLDSPVFQVGDRVKVIASGLEGTVTEKFAGAITKHTVYVLTNDADAVGFYGSELVPA